MMSKKTSIEASHPHTIRQRRKTTMLDQPKREAIARLWQRKLNQDIQKFPKSERHRNLEPVSAEFICALATGCRARRLVEIGGSSVLRHK